MTSGDYQATWKDLGKLADLLNAINTAATATVAAATSAITKLPNIVLQAAKNADETINAKYTSTITPNLAGALQNVSTSTFSGPLSQVINEAGLYLTSSTVIARFVHSTPAANLPAVLASLAAEMATDVVTLTTDAGAGLVNLLKTIGGSAQTWPQSGSPTYADGTYVTNTVL
jgi:hypothetical protein